MGEMKEVTRLPEGSVLVVGAGLAGLYVALKLAPRKVFVLTSLRSTKGAASAWAQGGMSVALGPGDTPEAHANDTILAGDGLVFPHMAKILTEEGPDRVRDLISMGVPFDTNPDGSLYLSLEAAHSQPRVARVKGDSAGRAIIDTLLERAKAADHIEALIGWRAETLIQDGNGGVAGVKARHKDGRLQAIVADATIMCTGGVGGLFEVTTNPKTARGDALGMGAAVGALIRDAEFVQFHPTAIDVGRDPAPLATEALRGEGAILINKTGKRFMDAYHADGELAPRDEVARAIFAEIQKGNQPKLDCTKAVGEHFPDEFPTVYAACMAFNIDPRYEPIPVAPAVHYHMGGLKTDDVARTTVDGLFAIGECTSTGVHGANRLASNSLLEAVVFAGRCADHINGSGLPRRSVPTIADQPWLSMEGTPTKILRHAMTQYCGVQRNAGGLNRLIDIIEDLTEKVGPANPLIAAKMIAAGALAREESRGGHYRTDFPEQKPRAISSRLTLEMLS